MRHRHAMVCCLSITLAACSNQEQRTANRTDLTQGPEPAGEIVAIPYKSGNVLYVEPLPPQSLTCVAPALAVGCPVARVWYGSANVTPEQQAHAEWLSRNPDLNSNWVLVVGHLATVTVRDHRSGHDPEPVNEVWFVVKKLYVTPSRGRVIERHSTQFFYTTGTASSAQVVAISRGEQSPRAARITWTGLATYGGSSGPSSVDDMYVTGQADFTRSPLPITADEYFIRLTR